MAQGHRAQGQEQRPGRRWGHQIEKMLPLLTHLVHRGPCSCDVTSPAFLASIMKWNEHPSMGQVKDFGLILDSSLSLIPYHVSYFPCVSLPFAFTLTSTTSSPSQGPAVTCLVNCSMLLGGLCLQSCPLYPILIKHELGNIQIRFHHLPP